MAAPSIEQLADHLRAACEQIKSQADIIATLREQLNEQKEDIAALRNRVGKQTVPAPQAQPAQATEEATEDEGLEQRMKDYCKAKNRKLHEKFNLAILRLENIILCPACDRRACLKAMHES